MTFTTNKLKLLFLNEGKYILREIVAPNGYILN
ncbi:SpaA isopeptide-forming pilin-related protein [uncultured Clostridium sp.]|nr:prealbumin-like fold domain-containing protein [Clostridium septicum]